MKVLLREASPDRLREEQQHAQIKTESIKGKKATRNQSVVVIILHLTQSTSIKHSQSDAIKSES